MMEANIICAWCKRAIGYNSKIQGISHGICEDCQKKYEADDLDENIPQVPVKVAFNLFKRMSKTISENQMINNIVVNLLFLNSGNQGGGGDRGEMMNNLRVLRDMGAQNVGKRILERLNESLSEETTVWFKLSEASRQSLKQSCYHDLKVAMESVISSDVRQ